MSEPVKTEANRHPEAGRVTNSPLDMAAGVAAPLLAAISFTLVALTLQMPPSDLRFADIALLLFVGAGLAFITAVQAGMWEVRYPAGASARSKMEHSLWKAITRMAYHAGILALLAATGILLVPRGPIPPVRCATVALTGAGLVGEVSWIVLTRKRKNAAEKRMAETT